MPDAPKLAKAELRQLDAKFATEINKDAWTIVQFNPETMKVSFSNQVATPKGAGDQNGTQAMQYVGAGTTKLALTLYFDVTSEIPKDLPQTNDVRRLTQRVAYFITPLGEPKNNPQKFIPPAVRFLWGSFQFDGIMDSLEENLEMFSFEGRPLRASMSLSLVQQRITEYTINPLNTPPAVTSGGGQAPGTSPKTEAPAGASLQSLTANQNGLASSSSGWQGIAAANGIENPRLLSPGQLVDLNITTG